MRAYRKNGCLCLRSYKTGFIQAFFLRVLVIVRDGADARDFVLAGDRPGHLEQLGGRGLDIDRVVLREDDRDAAAGRLVRCVRPDGDVF